MNRGRSSWDVRGGFFLPLQLRGGTEDTIHESFRVECKAPSVRGRRATGDPENGADGARNPRVNIFPAGFESNEFLFVRATVVGENDASDVSPASRTDVTFLPRFHQRYSTNGEQLNVPLSQCIYSELTLRGVLSDFAIFSTQAEKYQRTIKKLERKKLASLE